MAVTEAFDELMLANNFPDVCPINKIYIVCYFCNKDYCF